MFVFSRGGKSDNEVTLEKDNGVLKEKVNTLNANIKQHENTISDLKLEIERLRSGTANRDTDLSQLEREKTSLTQRLDTCNAEVRRLEGTIQELTSQNKVLDATTKSKDSEINKHKGTIHALEKTNQDREKDLNDLQHKIDTLNDQLHVEGNSVQELKKEAAAKGVQLSNVSTANASLATRSGALEEAKKYLNEKIKDLEQQLQKTRQEAQTEIIGLKDKVNNLTRDCQDLRASVAERDTNLATHKAEIESKTKSVEELQQRERSYQEKTKELESDSKHLTEKVTQLSASSSQQQQKINDIESKLKLAERLSEEGSRKVLELSTKFSAAEANVRSLEDERLKWQEWQKEKTAAIAKLDTEKEALGSEKAVSQEQLSSLRQRNAELEATVRELNKLTDDLKNKVDEQRIAFDAKEKELRESTDREHARQHEAKQEDLKFQKDTFKKQLDSATSQSENTIKELFTDRRRADDTTNKFMDFLMEQQKEQSRAMMTATLGPAAVTRGGASVAEIEDGKKKAITDNEEQ